MTRKRVTACLHGRMEGNMKVAGTWASNMERLSTRMPKERLKKECGSTGSERVNGFQYRKKMIRQKGHEMSFF